MRPHTRPETSHVHTNRNIHKYDNANKYKR